MVRGAASLASVSGAGDSHNLPSRSTYVVLQAEHTPASDDISSRSPHRHTHPVCRAGTPTTRACAGMSCVTTAPAPTNAYSPIVTPHTIVEFAPKDAPCLTSVRRYSDFRFTWLR